MASPYDYETCLRIIERKGKELYGEHFRIFQEDYPLIAKLLAYILKDEETCTQNGISLKKGILLTGPV